MVAPIGALNIFMAIVALLCIVIRLHDSKPRLRRQLLRWQTWRGISAEPSLRPSQKFSSLFKENVFLEKTCCCCCPPVHRLEWKYSDLRSGSQLNHQEGWRLPSCSRPP